MKNNNVSITLVRMNPHIGDPRNAVTQIKGAAKVTIGNQFFRTGDNLSDRQADELCLNYPNTTVKIGQV